MLPNVEVASLKTATKVFTNAGGFRQILGISTPHILSNWSNSNCTFSPASLRRCRGLCWIELTKSLWNSFLLVSICCITPIYGRRLAWRGPSSGSALSYSFVQSFLRVGVSSKINIHLDPLRCRLLGISSSYRWMPGCHLQSGNRHTVRGFSKCAVSMPWDWWPLIILGPVVYLNVAGQPIIVLNTHKAAADLLDRRANIYSDRPTNIVPAFLTGGLHIGLMHHGDMYVLCFLNCASFSDIGAKVAKNASRRQRCPQPRW